MLSPFSLRRNLSAIFLAKRQSRAPHCRNQALFSSGSIIKNSDIKWPVSRVRSQFVEYFFKQDHVNFKSSPVVPVNDPTLLFTNAGMNQFKPIFMGTADPSSPLAALKRAVNSQKCIRAGGKHNDLDDVGKDTYHHTFFEMLGTWSFGEYFKEEAIRWAYDLLVNVYKLPADRLYVSYFSGSEEDGLPADLEARNLWMKYIPEDRILAFSKKENFWEMGDTGPCGPCTEIHFDRIGGRNAASLVNKDDPDVIEIWNLVFIQFNRETGGRLTSLPEKHVDTGMGLERITSILQNKRSNYDTDAFVPIFNAIQKEIGCAPYSGKLGAEDSAQNFKDMAYRVIADHIRTLSFAIADGAVPSSDGRGYVLRRILRRAVRYGMQTLGAQPGFFAKLVDPLIHEYGEAFPELVEKRAEIVEVLQEEERSFAALLDKGIRYFGELEAELKRAGSITISGERAFYMYDSLGFPLDLTQIMAEEKGLKVDMPGFRSAMQQQKERSKQAMALKRLANHEPIALSAAQTSQLQQTGVLPTDVSQTYAWDTPFSTKVKAIICNKEFVQSIDKGVSCDAIGVVLEASPFYAESGGQVADMGTLQYIDANGQRRALDVLDVQSYAGYRVHTCVPQALSSEVGKNQVQIVNPGLEGLSTESEVEVHVDYARRRKIAPNHTMSHVLNYALRRVLGSTVEQKGSHVSEDKLRFDFSCKKALTPHEVLAVEDIINEVIGRGNVIHTQVVPLQQALKINGLRAVFGETYPDPVRVVSVGPPIADLLACPGDAAWIDHSVEFCGGTHVSNTAEALACCVVEETAVSKGIRRISAITGVEAQMALSKAESFKSAVGMLTKSVLDASSNTSINMQHVDGLDVQLVALRANLDAAMISHGVKALLRSELETLQKKIKGLRSDAIRSEAGAIIAAGLRDAQEQLSKSGEMKAVRFMDIGSDTKAIKWAVEEMKKVHPDYSFMGISRENDKLTVFAFVSDAAQRKGMNAHEWVLAVVRACGGKGGGKAALAQGSFSDPSQAKLVLEEANEYLNKFL